MNEVVDVSFTSCHEHSLHGYFEEHFDRVLVEVQFEKHYWGKQMPEKYENNHGFYDPVAEYME